MKKKSKSNPSACCHGKHDGRKSHFDFARIDWEREARCGFPEFIYGEGKTKEQLEAIGTSMLDKGLNVFITRISTESANFLKARFTDAEHFCESRILRIIRKKIPQRGNIIIAAAGTTDLPVANEAKLTAEFCGCRTELAADIGIAGIHRLFSELDRLSNADVVIAVAGMEGALPSVIGGLVPCPVIAVPTSIGYGTSLKGMTALFAMLNSCSSGITVVNIDNGFGAGCAAARIIKSKYRIPDSYG